MKTRCVMMGSGGHALVLLDCLKSAGHLVAGILVPDSALWGTKWRGIPVLGGDALLPKLRRRGIPRFAVGVAGDLGLRERLLEAGLKAGLKPVTVIHPSAVLSPSARIGEGAQVFPGVVVNAEASLGVHAIANTGAIVEHECVVGDHAHVASGARLAGAVRVGARAFIGAGASVRQGLSIGAGAVVAMGAAVIRDVKAGQTVAGVPARPR